MKRYSALILILFFSLLGGFPPSSKFKYLVTSVIDGDTVMLNSREKLRLVYIDTPELKQRSFGHIPIGELSKKALMNFLNPDVSVKVQGKDIYGRLLGELWDNKKNVSLNYLMIKAGMAYLYPYSRFKNNQQKLLFLKAYQNAVKNKQGIFSVKAMYTPWVYRRKNKLKRAKIAL